MTPRPGATIVVPCFDEAERLRPDAVRELAASSGARVLLVDDGSTDATPQVLDALVAAVGDPGTIASHRLARNSGKAEAVRRGMRLALDDGAAVVGYCDADFSTPPHEVARLLVVLDDTPDVDVVLGSRVGLLGSDVQRAHVRHYLGRLFATAASAALRMKVYDTQCGAKVFADTPALRAALADPFRSVWAFDVELLARLRHGAPPTAPGLGIERFLEIPLRTWRDVGASKLTVRGAGRAAVDVARIAIDGRRRRAAGRR
ncbi:hypothetical protein BH24ACT6_BH24ACT6_21410 [soil metagenome]